ncbi:hypothetical protein [Olleya sp. R77988]|uniref:hypothetical protein n=1 Tax=Olleya sp. R77988 TaxID=3093875 RepID=UPI0037C9D6A1
MKLFSLLFICLVSTLSFAQSKLAKTAINKLNEQLKVYETLSPHGDLYHYKDLKLSKIELLVFEGTDEVVNDSIESYAAISIIQDKISKLLNTVFIIKSVEEFNLKNQLYSNINYIKSEDNKLHNLTLHAKSGGSYQSSLSYIYYKKNEEYIKVFETYDEDENSVFNADGYYSIDTISSREGTKYLLIGSVRTCGMCFYDYVSLVYFKDGYFNQEFNFSVESRSYDSKIFYNPSEFALSVFYETDDLNYHECSCKETNNEEDVDYEEDIKEKQCSCLFIFNGLTFELTNQCSEAVIEKE